MALADGDDRPSQLRETPDSRRSTAALWTAGYGMPVRSLVGTGVGALGLLATRATRR